MAFTIPIESIELRQLRRAAERRQAELRRQGFTQGEIPDLPIPPLPTPLPLEQELIPERVPGPVPTPQVPVAPPPGPRTQVPQAGALPTATPQRLPGETFNVEGIAQIQKFVLEPLEALSEAVSQSQPYSIGDIFDPELRGMLLPPGGPTQLDPQPDLLPLFQGKAGLQETGQRLLESSAERSVAGQIATGIYDLTLPFPGIGMGKLAGKGAQAAKVALATERALAAGTGPFKIPPQGVIRASDSPPGVAPSAPLPEQPGPIAGPPGPPPLGAATQLPPGAVPQVAPVVPGNIISRIVRTSAGRFFMGEDTTRLMDKNLNALTVDELNGVLAEALRGVSSSSPGVSRDADRLANALFEEAARRGLRREQLETNIWPTFTAPETAIAPSQVPEAPLAGVPPVRPPTELPTGAIPPPDPIPGPPANITRALEQAESFSTIDAPGFVGRAIDKIPGISNIQQYLRPANKLPPKIQNAWVASGGERAAFATDQFPSRSRIFQQIDDLFGSRTVDESGRRVRGPSPVEGGKTNVRFIGPESERVGIEGTILDIAQRPQFYDLTDEMRAFLTEWQVRQSRFQQELIQGYGAKVGEFIPAQEGSVFLRNVDKGEDMLTAMNLSEEQAIRQGAGKTRVFETAADRMRSNPDFDPVVDIRKLQSGMDDWRSAVAGNQVFKEGVGGLTRVEAVALKHPDLLKLKNSITTRISNIKARISTAEGQMTTSGTEIIRVSTRLNNATKKADDILPDIEALELLKEDGWGPELSFLSGQIREILQQAASLERQGLNLTEKATGAMARRGTLIDELEQLTPLLNKVRRQYAAADLRPLQFQKDVFRYFPADEARGITKLSEYNSSHWVTFLDNMRGGIFAGDLSPIAGVQLPLSFLFQPHRAIPRLVGAGKNSVQSKDLLNVFRESTMLKVVEANPQLARDFAFFSGFPVQTGTPQEFAGGFLRFINPRIPGTNIRLPLGKKFQVANERMYSVVLRQSMDLFDNLTKQLAGAGVLGDEAGVLAADMAAKVFPMWNPFRLGLSQSRAATIRALPTSVSFMLQPAALVGEATTGFAKIALKQTLTPQEKLAVQFITVLSGSIMSLTISSASIDALIRGNDPIEAIKNATNPISGKFGNLFLPGTGRSIPLGGPFRGIFKAIVPREVDWAPVPIPFANIGNFFLNRVNPFLGTQIKQIRNKDYFGGKIWKGELPERVIRGLAFELEGSLPLMGGTAISGIRRGIDPGDIAEEVAAQALGVNLGQETAFQQRDLAVQKFVQEHGIERGKVFQLIIDGEIVEVDQSQKIKSFYDLIPADRRRFEAEDPGSVAKTKGETKRQADQGIKFAVTRQDAEDLKEESMKFQLADDDLLINNEISPTEWIKKRRKRKDSLNDKRGQIYSNIDTRDPETVIDYYFAEFDRIKTKFNDVMTDDAWQELEFWIESQPLETQQFIDANTGLAPMTPKEQEYKEDLVTLHPYFDIRDYIIRDRDTFEISESLAKQYQEWLDAGPGDRAAIKRSNPDIRKIESKLVPDLQFLMRFQNPKIDRLVIKWEYSTSLPRNPANLRELQGATP